MRGSFLTALLIAATANGQEMGSNSDDPHVQILHVLQTDEIEVDFEVRSHASPLDRRWMTLVFRNLTDQPLEISHARYRIERIAFDSQTGEPRSGGRALAYGDRYNLFPEAWERGQPGPVRIVLGPNETIRISDTISDAATGHLPIAPTRTSRVEADLTFELQIDGEMLPPIPPVPFAFEWWRIDQRGLEHLFLEFQSMLQEPPDSRHGRASLLEALLANSEIGGRLSTHDLMQVLDAWEDKKHTPRDVVLRHMQDRVSRVDPALVAWIRTRLEAGNIWAVRDTEDLDVWDDSFVESLVQMIEQRNYHWYDVLGMLDENCDSWRTDNSVVKRLSAAVWELMEASAPEVDLATNPKRWASVVERLAMTRDSALLDFFQPGLDVTSLITDVPRRFSTPWSRPYPPARICDVALDGILTLRLGRSEDGYSYGRVNRMSSVPDEERDAAYMQLRDEMIAELKKSLENER